MAVPKEMDDLEQLKAVKPRVGMFLSGLRCCRCSLNMLDGALVVPLCQQLRQVVCNGSIETITQIALWVELGLENPLIEPSEHSAQHIETSGVIENRHVARVLCH